MENNAVPSVPKHVEVKVQALSGSNQRIARRVRLTSAAAVLLLLSAAAFGIAHDSDRFVPKFQEFSDPDGRFANFNPGGPTDTTNNAFFQDLGTNGRRCVTCHQASDAWSDRKSVV